MARKGDRKREWGKTIARTTVKIPTNTYAKLKLLQTAYSDCWGRHLAYDQILERLMSSEGLGHIDPPVYDRFRKLAAAENDIDEIIMRPTGRKGSKNASCIVEEASPVVKEDDNNKAPLYGILQDEMMFHAPYAAHRHSYKFVGPDGEFEACDSDFGICCLMGDEEDECPAWKMFERGYKLVRDDGKEFTSLDIQVQDYPGDKPRIAKAFRLDMLDD